MKTLKTFVQDFGLRMIRSRKSLFEEECRVVAAFTSTYLLEKDLKNVSERKLPI
jgi:hypothetical protein